MATTWDEKLAGLSTRLAELSEKAASAAQDAKAYRELQQEAIQDKISTAKGNVAAMQENARIAGEETEGKIRGALLKARMTARAKREDLKEAVDKKRLDNFIDDGIQYIYDCYNAATFLVEDAELTILEVADALREYEAKYGAAEE